MSRRALAQAAAVLGLALAALLPVAATSAAPRHTTASDMIWQHTTAGVSPADMIWQ